LSDGVRIVFVTGTDTGVGKTRVTAALAAALRARGRGVAALKPIETGVVAAEWSASDAVRLAAASGRPGDALHEGCLRFAAMVSPHVAARAAGTRIDVNEVARATAAAAAGCTLALVEGAGGLLVPLDDAGATMADLAAALGASVLVVARAALGTINHTLLTVRAAEARGLPLLGVVVNETRPEAEAAADVSASGNAQEIARLVGCPVWGPLPWAKEGAARWIEDGAPGLVEGLCA
jgi:dethiobiotin synthetase